MGYEDCLAHQEASKLKDVIRLGKQIYDEIEIIGKWMKHKQLALHMSVIKEIEQTTSRESSRPNKPIESSKFIGSSSIIGSNNFSFLSEIQAQRTSLLSLTNKMEVKFVEELKSLDVCFAT